MKVATVTKMYQQDVDNEGMDNPVVLEQYANQDLKSAMQLERAYFDKNQMSCNSAWRKVVTFITTYHAMILNAKWLM